MSVINHMGILEPGESTWAWFPDLGTIHIHRSALMDLTSYNTLGNAPKELDAMTRHGEAIRLYNSVTGGSMLFHYDHSVTGTDGRRTLATFKNLIQDYTLQVWDSATGWAMYRERYIHPDAPNLITASSIIS